jgi:hypothetical protein
MELEGSALPEIAKDIEIMADQSGEQPLSRSHTSGGS